MFWFLWAGCDVKGVVEAGTVLACLEGPDGEIQDDEVTLDGVVGPSPATGSACDASAMVAITTKEANWVLGFELRDGSDEDITPALELSEGDTVSLLFRDKMVWGNVAGFVLNDFEGALVVAADEGGWGGALDPGEVDGLTVQRGADMVVTEATDCQPKEGYELSFSSGDTEITLTPVESQALEMHGASYTATAIAAWDYGESSGCQMSDGTGYTSWAVYR